MGLEAGTYIDSLNSSNPVASDPKSQGDDHIRLLKSTIKASFPGISGAVTATQAELNHMVGVTSAVQTQINLKAPLASPALTGSPTAPTQTAGDNSTKLATTEYVDQRAFSTSLPTQTSQAGKFLQTDGTNASWAFVITSPLVAYNLGAL